MSEMPYEVWVAMDVVQREFPDVWCVIFAPDGTWLFLDAHGKAPDFEQRIDVAVLERASNAVEADAPVAFFDVDVYNRVQG